MKNILSEYTKIIGNFSIKELTEIKENVEMFLKKTNRCLKAKKETEFIENAKINDLDFSDFKEFLSKNRILEQSFSFSMIARNLEKHFIDSLTGVKKDLAKAVIKQIDCENFFMFLDNYRDASVGISGFIYYTETEKFAKDNLSEILEIMAEYNENTGGGQNVTDTNSLSWFALENIVTEYDNFLDCNNIELDIYYKPYKK